MVECGGLENRYTACGIGSSNLPLSAHGRHTLCAFFIALNRKYVARIGSLSTLAPTHRNAIYGES